MLAMCYDTYYYIIDCTSIISLNCSLLLPLKRTIAQNKINIYFP